jgi:hypothetical protein
MGFLFPFTTRNSTAERYHLDKTSLLSVISSLVLQPLPIILNAANLFAIVIRDRIGEGVGGWINTKLLYSVVEFLLSLCLESALTEFRSNNEVRIWIKASRRGGECRA